VATGLPPGCRCLGRTVTAPSWGVFTNLQLDDGVLLQFAEPGVEIQMNHYAAGSS
jgi:hypothetical protein